MKKAVCICSSGIDSTTNALMLLKEGYEVHFLHIPHGQRCELGERLAVEAIVQSLKDKGYNCQLHIIEANWLGKLGGSALTDKSMSIPNGIQGVISNTKGRLFVPARNVVFISMAAALAESMKAGVITLGCNQSEAKQEEQGNTIEIIGYPDNSKAFLDTFTEVLEYGCYRIQPLVCSPEWWMDKPEIIKWGYDNGFDWVYILTYSSDDEPILRSGCTPGIRQSYMTSGTDGCSRNRRLAYYILDKLYPGKYPDYQPYANERWFYDVFLPRLKELDFSHKWWWKYKEVL